jgi:hypothetical protein
LPAYLNLIEQNEFLALWSFLTGVLPGTVPVEQGQVNRVAEPGVPDFVVMWPLRRERLSTNVVSVFDNIITGSIAGSALTVTALARSQAPLGAGTPLTDGTAGLIAPNTAITAQVSGSAGGTGIYNVAPPQTLGAETLYAGVRTDLTPCSWTVQLDVHGPNSADNAQTLLNLLRSEAATAAFEAQVYDVEPLYCDDARQIPFINAEQQYENRWTMDAVFHLNPTVSTPQQFADKLQVKLDEADGSGSSFGPIVGPVP